MSHYEFALQMERTAIDSEGNPGLRLFCALFFVATMAFFTIFRRKRRRPSLEHQDRGLRNILPPKGKRWRTYILGYPPGDDYVRTKGVLNHRRKLAKDQTWERYIAPLFSKSTDGWAVGGTSRGHPGRPSQH